MHRWFCQKEMEQALQLAKPLVLLRETDTRHGAHRLLPGSALSVRCAMSGCSGAAECGPPGARWPSSCKAHAEALNCTSEVIGIAASVSSDALNGALLHEELIKARAHAAGCMAHVWPLRGPWRSTYPRKTP